MDEIEKALMIYIMCHMYASTETRISLFENSIMIFLIYAIKMQLIIILHERVY